MDSNFCCKILDWERTLNPLAERKDLWYYVIVLKKEGLRSSNILSCFFGFFKLLQDSRLRTLNPLAERKDLWYYVIVLKKEGLRSSNILSCFFGFFLLLQDSRLRTLNLKPSCRKKRLTVVCHGNRQNNLIINNILCTTIHFFVYLKEKPLLQQRQMDYVKKTIVPHAKRPLFLRQKDVL